MHERISRDISKGLIVMDKNDCLWHAAYCRRRAEITEREVCAGYWSRLADDWESIAGITAGSLAATYQSQTCSGPGNAHANSLTGFRGRSQRVIL